MKALIALAAMLPALAACVDPSAKQKAAAKAAAVEKAVEYLGDFAEYRIDRNYVWMKFKAYALPDDIVWVVRRGHVLPEDFSWIVRGAALKAHLAYGSGAHVYLLADQSKLSEVPAVRLICSASARYGKIEKSDC